jgi:hypothetical protein
MFDFKHKLFCAILFFFRQSNDSQKAQYNTDLLEQRHGYLYRKWWHWLNLKALIKMRKKVKLSLEKLKGEVINLASCF